VAKNELASNLEGFSADEKTQAALKFATQLIEQRGRVTEHDVEMVREAGFTDEELVEIVAHVGMNTLTNYFNEAFKTEVDFPLVQTEKVRKAS